MRLYPLFIMAQVVFGLYPLNGLIPYLCNPTISSLVQMWSVMPAAIGGVLG